MWVILLCTISIAILSIIVTIILYNHFIFRENRRKVPNDSIESHPEVSETISPPLHKKKEISHPIVFKEECNRTEEKISVVKYEIPPIPTGDVVSAPDHSFGVLSYNIRCDKDSVPFSWAQRKGPVREAILESGMNIVCVQECRELYAKDLCSSLGKSWRLSGVPRKKEDEGTQILFDASKFTYIDSSTWVYHDEGIRQCPPTTHCTEVSFLGRRRCAHVRIFTHVILLHKVTNVAFNIINTHFPLEKHEQMVCARQLGEYIAKQTELAWPMIVCGDFNSHYSPKEEGSPLSYLAEAVPDVFDVHGYKDFPTYYEGFEHDVLPPGFLAETTAHSHRLDYIFARVSGNMPVRVGEGVVHHPRYSDDSGKKYRPSDHEPISVMLYIKNGGNMDK